MHLRRLSISLLFAGLAGACASEPEALDDGEAAISALSNPLSGPKVYLVELANGVDIDSTLDDLSVAHGAAATHRYHHALRGGALLVPNDAARAAIAADPRVARVEPDQEVSASGKTTTTPPPQKTPTGYRLIGADVTANEGAGTRVAVLDTGIDLTHSDLAANIDKTIGRDCVNESGPAMGDLNGHGTHVAGTIAALDNIVGSVGVGTQIKVVPVKVLNRRGSGTWSTIICGIDHVTANVASIQVANMSLGGAGSECVDGGGCTKSLLQLAIERSVAAGITYAVAAGNEGANAAGSVPAAYDAVITVSAYSDADGVLGGGGWPTFTNYGADVDIAAPGVSIFSTWKGNTYNTISGTSMASPHVAAAAALYLATQPGMTPAAVRDALVLAATTTYPGSTDAKHAEPLLNVRSF